MYRYDEQATNPNTQVWQRTATAIEAIVHHLHQKIRATFDSELWRENAAQQAAEVENENGGFNLNFKPLIGQWKMLSTPSSHSNFQV